MRWFAVVAVAVGFTMRWFAVVAVAVGFTMRWFAVVAVAVGLCGVAGAQQEPLWTKTLGVDPPHISTDPSVRYDYDIVYVRARRDGDEVHKRYYTDIATPVTLEPGADLVLLRPDGSEEVLVEGGAGAITDPFVSFDGEWVYYTHIDTMQGAGPWQPPKGADIFKIHVRSRRIVRLTNQKFTPNTGAADWAASVLGKPGAADDQRRKTHLSYGVLNFGACPLPGGKIVYTSNRNALRPPRAYPQIAMQLFVMDDRDESIGEDEEANIEQIGHLNIAGALHPVVMTDGRIMFSTLESQGIRSEILWGIWTMHPDGTNWAPLVSAFDPGGAPNAFHFQSQLSDGSLVVEGYYNQNNSGFGTYVKLPLRPPAGEPAFGPAWMNDPRNRPWRFGRNDNGRPRWYRMPFMPAGSEALTAFAHIHDGPADPSVLGDKNSPRVGKVTHPSGAPDNHLLTIWSPGPTNHQYTYLPQLNGGIYLIKNGQVVDEPGQMLRIKLDPRYNAQWPRAVVPYERIYGMKEPKRLEPLANDGGQSRHLPAGTPLAMIGTSSLYKRESYPNGVVPKGSVTAQYAGGNDPWKGLDAFTSHGNGMPINWHNQGADAGLYDNSDIHALRILVMEPTTDRNRGERPGRLFHSHARERLRILGEIPVRKFAAGKQPLDPDGNPDTSFLAKIPADTAFTFQTIDKHGMVLNMSQTWHQLRPGEVRHDCGGCHAHSQQPTEFRLTAAARDDYEVWDLTERTPLVVDKPRDQSQRKWDERDETGLRMVEAGVVNVEYFRDVQPILKRSCTACHAATDGRQPAGNLSLDADDQWLDIPHQAKVPGTYYRLAADERAQFGHKPVGYDSWGYPQASRYVRMFQSRRSLLVWKVFGKRLDGFANDDHPSEPVPGAGTLVHRGEAVDVERNRARLDIDLLGSVMPPPEAVAGTYTSADGRTIKVEPLSDEDRRTLVRWIDLGCPIDLDRTPLRAAGDGSAASAAIAAGDGSAASAAASASAAATLGYGWMADDNRPVLALAYPRQDHTGPLERIVVGAHDYYSGLDRGSFEVVANFEVDGAAAGENLAPRLRVKSAGVWELVLERPVANIAGKRLTISVRDRQGNVSRIVREFRAARD